MKKNIEFICRRVLKPYLYYGSSLQRELELVTAVQSMCHSTESESGWKDDLKNAVQENYLEEGAKLGCVEKMLVKDQSWKEKWQKAREMADKQLKQLGDCPKGDEYSTEVIEWKAKQGDIQSDLIKMQIKLKKQWLIERELDSKKQ